MRARIFSGITLGEHDERPFEVRAIRVPQLQQPDDERAEFPHQAAPTKC